MSTSTNPETGSNPNGGNAAGQKKQSWLVLIWKKLGLDVLSLLAAVVYVVTNITSLGKDVEFIKAEMSGIRQQISKGDSTILTAIGAREGESSKLRKEVQYQGKEISRIQGNLKMEPAPKD